MDLEAILHFALRNGPWLAGVAFSILGSVWALWHIPFEVGDPIVHQPPTGRVIISVSVRNGSRMKLTAYNITVIVLGTKGTRGGKTTELERMPQGDGLVQGDDFGVSFRVPDSCGRLVTLQIEYTTRLRRFLARHLTPHFLPPPAQRTVEIPAAAPDILPPAIRDEVP